MARSTLRYSYSVLRWKLMAMSAILEATPDFADTFLPQPRAPWYVVYIGFVALRAALKGAIGVVPAPANGARATSSAT